MEADELFDHALSSLPEAVGDLLREGRDPGQFVFASFDGASQLGMALIASDLSNELGVDSSASRIHVERMLREASQKGEELVVSMMVTKEVLARMLNASKVDPDTRLAVGMWLESPLDMGHFRVVAIAGQRVRAATVDGASDLDEAPVSSSMLN